MRNWLGSTLPTSRVCISTMHTPIRLDEPVANLIRRRMFQVVGRCRAATGVMMAVGKAHSALRVTVTSVPATVVVRSAPSEVSARARSVCRVVSSSRNENIASRLLRERHAPRTKAVAPTISAALSPRSSPISIPVRRTMRVAGCKRDCPMSRSS